MTAARIQSAPVAARTGAPPALRGVFETSLYVPDLAAAEKFYGGVLGLEKVFEVAGRQLVYRTGDSILLIFQPERTGSERILIGGGAIPLHGSKGPGHVAFHVPAAEMKSWRLYFQANDVGIESEVDWPNGAHSIYFRDPAGNSLELATADLWTASSS